MGIIYSVKEVKAPRRIPREGCIDLPSEPRGEAGAGQKTRAQERTGFAPGGLGERGKEQVCRRKGQSWRQKGQAELWGLKRCHTGETFVWAGLRSGA